MKDDQDRREGELISLRAAEWLVRLYGGPSPGQPRDYWRWLKKSQEHVIAALDIGRIHALPRRMKMPFSIIDDPQTDLNVVECFPTGTSKADKAISSGRLRLALDATDRVQEQSGVAHVFDTRNFRPAAAR